MDAELHRRWRKGEPPLDGLTLHPEELLPLSNLQTLLLRLLPLLQARWQGCLLYRLHDWHEHDGYINRPRVITWSDLVANVESEGLHEALPRGGRPAPS